MRPSDQRQDATSGQAAAGRLGNFLYYLGVLLFPMCLGAVGGFYLADMGVRWLPDTIGLILSGCIGALMLVISGRYLRGKLFTETENGRVMSRRFQLASVLVILAIGMRLSVWWMEAPSALTELPPEQFEAAWEMDRQRFIEFDQSMDGILERLDEHAMFAEGDRPLSPDEEALLLASYRGVYDYLFALDQVRMFYEDWYRFDPSRAERSYHLRSFLLLHLSELVLYEKSVRLFQIVDRNGDAEKFLNAPHPALGLPQDSLSRLRQDLHGSRDSARLLAAQRYRSFFGGALQGEVEARKFGAGDLWDLVDAHRQAINAVAPLERGSTTVRGDLQVLKRVVRRSWYPTQSAVAEWFGDTRTRRIGWYLIQPEQVQEMLPELQPGDVLLSRKNWYLSNVGLPGFWPHGLVYLGEPETFEAYYDEPEVRAWILAETGKDQALHELLADRYPEHYLSYRVGDGGHPFRVMEAISEGVVFNTLEHAAGDYLVALRPRLDKVAKAQAVLAAFEHLDKPYDYDFDFATDHALVCTELVWRMYRPAEGKVGLDLHLVEVAGRRTLPANELARQYAIEADTPEQQLDFVWFWDARERDQRAVRADEAAFRASFERVKWDVAQK